MTGTTVFFFGIRGTANAWLNKYLTNRNRYVIADDHSSGMRLITCGYHRDQYSGSSFVYSLHQ